MHNDKEILDKWGEALEIQIKFLKECQKQKQIKSCMLCQEILHCSIRKEYINAVYASMNKGSTGGFEF
jgi:hypothetical protein